MTQINMHCQIFLVYANGENDVHISHKCNRSETFGKQNNFASRQKIILLDKNKLKHLIIRPQTSGSLPWWAATQIRVQVNLNDPCSVGTKAALGDIAPLHIYFFSPFHLCINKVDGMCENRTNVTPFTSSTSRFVSPP